MITLRTRALLLLALCLGLAGCHPPPRPAQDAPRADELVFQAQPGWVEEPPAMAMRVAQYRLPGEGAEDASLVVFRFAGNGTIQQNFARWVGQFQQPDGRSSVEVAKTRQFYAGGLPIYVLDVTGIFVAETRPGSGVRENKQDWRMIGAVAEASDELVFVKATGPDATLERWSASIDAFLHRLVE